MRTLKCNKTQGAAITVCLLWQENNTESKTIHQTARAESKATGDRIVHNPSP